jgi:SWIM zinc finger
MKLLQEVTEWEKFVPSHIYIFENSESKIIGYIPTGTKEPIKFSKPMPFDRRGRKFVPSNQLKRKVQALFAKEIEKEPNFRTWKIKGSKGNQYTVSESDSGLTCSCPGYLYRGPCKHITSIQQGAI